MVKRISVKGAARAAAAEERRTLVALDRVTKDHDRLAKGRGRPTSGSEIGAATLDSFVNFQHSLGIGANNAMSSSSYGFNPITRNRTILEWIHRGSWLGGLAVDVIADDMTRAGIEYETTMEPKDSERIDTVMTTMGVWTAIGDTIRWARLYGGAIGVVLIDGQDPSTPLRPETVGPGQFKGLAAFDRWMVEPSMGDLVTEFGPMCGTPKFYRVTANAPILRGQVIHYSRVMFRLLGNKLPYQQALSENLWGTSVLERVFDRMVGFDTATTGAIQLVYKAYLRTFKIKGLRDIVASGGKAMEGLIAYVNLMRQYQGIEGMTMLDSEDEFDAQAHGAFSGLDLVIGKVGEQLSGAFQIPLVRLFGQSPGGLSSDGDSALRTYYDGVKHRQESDCHTGVNLIYRMAAASEGITVPDNFRVGFRSLWQLKPEERATITKTVADAVIAARDAGLLSDRVGMQELRQVSRTTGVFTNITSKNIESANEEVEPPEPDLPPGMEGLPALKGEEDDSRSSGGKGAVQPGAKG